jgi:hypothetical protein
VRVSMSSNPALTGGCAGYSHSASVINVDSNEFAPWAGSDAGSAALVMAHELGHFLGLGEAGVGSGTIEQPLAGSIVLRRRFIGRNADCSDQ